MLKRLSRIYYPVKLTLNKEYRFTDDKFHYLSNVMRLKKGFKFRIFNQNDGEYICTILNVSKKDISFSIDEMLNKPHSNNNIFRLLFAPIKMSRMTFMIEKATELGINHFQPIITEYSQIKEFNKEKLMRVINEAVEQSESLVMPEMFDPISLEDAINKYNTIICALERNDGLQKITKNNVLPECNIMIGPEGGFSDNERNLFIQNQNKIISISLGKQILRAETAAITLTSWIKYINEFE